MDTFEIDSTIIEKLQPEHDQKLTYLCGLLPTGSIDCDVISGQNVTTVEDYVGVNFEVVGSKTFRDIKQEAHHQVGLGETHARRLIRKLSAFRGERCSVSPIPVDMATKITADSDSARLLRTI